VTACSAGDAAANDATVSQIAAFPVSAPVTDGEWGER